jgi:DNA-binding transcriptional MerR regulator
MWRDLALTMSQAAALTGVSERQIQHWMDKGYIPVSDGARKINGDNLDKIVLIRQARIAGIPLRRAVALAQEYLRREHLQMVDGDVVQGALRELDEGLSSLSVGIQYVQRIIGDMQPMGSDGADGRGADSRVAVGGLPASRRHRVSSQVR